MKSFIDRRHLAVLAATTCGAVLVASTATTAASAALPADEFHVTGGTVVDSVATPLAGTEVTLLRADPAGTFSPVPAGSVLLSPETRRNPVLTGADGAFGWKAVAGNYRLRFTRTGCRPIAGNGQAANSYWLPSGSDASVLGSLDCSGGQVVPQFGGSITPDPMIVRRPARMVMRVSGPDGAPATGTMRFATGDDPLRGAVPGCERVPLRSGQAECLVTFHGPTLDEPNRVSVLYSGNRVLAAQAGRWWISVVGAAPTVTWAAPAPIRAGSPLGAAQLNATADVPGHFAYTVHATGRPAAGAVLAPGAGQVLDAVFFPDDTDAYRPVLTQVRVTVLAGRSCTAGAAISSAWPGGFVAQLRVTAGGEPLTGWTVTTVLASGATITDTWSAQADGTRGTVRLSNTSYNGKLAAGQSRSFGFQGSGPAGVTVTSCTAR